jgi:hypothetical protein
MHKLIKLLVSPLICGALMSCASTFHMSEHAKDLRTRMTLREAESLLAQYARPSAARGGLCMTGDGAMAQLDSEAPVRVSDFVIKFSAFHATRDGQFTLDARDLKEIRVLEADPRVSTRCRNYKPGYAIILKPNKRLPDKVEVSINASSQSELDTILAALTTMSPRARLTAGYGPY